MKKALHTVLCLFSLLFVQIRGTAQTSYCCGAYSTGQCNQPGPSNTTTNFINDFIDNFSTTGGNTNIYNLSSGCNGQPNNCMFYCNHYLAVSPGQTIVCTIQSGITFAQGFALWVDWDQ